MFSVRPYGTQPYSEFVASGSSTAYTLSAAQGSYTVTGEAATLNRGIKITAVQGSYALSGQSTTSLAIGMPAVQGSYSLTGEAATIGRSVGVYAAQGSYSLTGEAATPNAGIGLTASQGNYLLNGEPVAFVPVPPSRAVGWIGKPTKRWWEELQEEYQQQYDRERPSQAKQAVKARKTTRKIAEEAVEDGLLTPFNAAPIAQLLASVQNAAKVSDAMEASKAFMAAMERLREEDEEDAILLLS